jgi:D-aminopeptidase
MEVDGNKYTLGVLVLTNHGRLSDLTVNRKLIGPDLADKLMQYAPDKGSCIIIAATDLPLDSRQLGRVLRRASVGLARLGSYIGEGSGEVFLGFSTANAFDPRETRSIRTGQIFSDNDLDLPFRAIAECTEEAVLNSLLTANTVVGHTGKQIFGLKDLYSTFD